MMTDHWTSFTVVIRALMAPMITDVTPTHAVLGHIWLPFVLFQLVRTNVVNNQIKSRGHGFVSGIEAG